MEEQRNESDWSNFATFRHTWIVEADRIMAECAEWTATDVNRDDKSRRLWRRAAKLYERAADFYRRGTLGLMASRAWEAAAACYAALHLHEDASRCRRKADSIPEYWNEDDSSRPENQGGRS